MLAKSLGLTADNVTYDLEDSVTAHEKANAREALARHLQTLSASAARPPGLGEIAARINAVQTPYALQDLQLLGKEPALDVVVVPKVRSASDLAVVADVLRQVAPQRRSRSRGPSPPPPVKLLALIESAEAVLNLASICKAGVSDGLNLAGLIFAAEDFSLDLGLTRTPSLREFLYARSAIAIHARAFHLPSTIDLVCTAFRGPEAWARLEEESIEGKGLGFNGKQCIHPSQIDIAQRAFSPSKGELEWSVRIVVADEKAMRGDRAGEAGRGAWMLDGKMIDAPLVAMAKAVVERAKRCGFDVDRVREKWKDQTPE